MRERERERERERVGGKKRNTNLKQSSGGLSLETWWSRQQKRFLDRNTIPLALHLVEFCRKRTLKGLTPIGNLNSLVQIAGGLCDNLLTCIVRAWDYSKPFFIAPSMNTMMWKNPFTERLLMSIDELGISLIPPVTKRQACGDSGNGAMAEPADIYSTVRLFFESKIRQDGSNIQQLAL
ncbi:probable phosphopantothenoylcysteine decarboxylase isoform X3 [Carya illinoinensis]|uniref:probable phosphopantothenoylcysteine decarboxylase isoform X3 n=1 Tax=Carya illinoinensis TaxID=32201 RepID=UPI001C721158|nr:probable phosphopantothenoylcysteine decarboxylase isoform X3 [Carya illinoinensis]